MMLASPEPARGAGHVHASLRRMPEMLTAERIVATARVAHAALRRDFGIAAPRLAVAGLNPHAGEDGAHGRGGDQMIAPAIARCGPRASTSPARARRHACSPRSARRYDAACACTTTRR